MAHAKHSSAGDDALAYLPLLLLLPAAVTLQFWDEVRWAGWVALVVGAVGIISVPVAVYIAKQTTRVGWAAYLVLGIMTAKVVSGGWGFLT